MVRYSNRWGRNYKKKPLIEDCLCLNADELKKAGVFNDEFEAELTYEQKPDEEVLLTTQQLSEYTYQVIINSFWQLSVEFKPFKHGGGRYFFVCPGCKNHYSKLWKPPSKQDIECRKCLGLVYRSSQSQRKINQFLRRITTSVLCEHGITPTEHNIKRAALPLFSFGRKTCGNDYSRRRGELKLEHN